MVPKTRIELLLAYIVGDISTLLRPPRTRAELFLSKVAGEDVELPDPINRFEQYFAKMAGVDVDVPKPVSRVDRYLAALFGVGEKPAFPISRIEYYLDRLQGAPGVWTIVRGTTPIVLEDAVACAIKRLVQFGRCTQDSTPSPSAPAAIRCNNGVLKIVDNELPVGYTRVKSITFGASTYYNTGKKLYGTDVVEMTISDFTSGGQNLFGSYSGSSDDVYNFSLYIYGTATGQAYWRYGQTLYRPVVGSTGTRTITFGAGGTTGFKIDVTYDTTDFETTDAAWIGALPNSSSPKFTGTIIGDIIIGTRLKYIPCVRASDGAIGYYETVNGEFLEPVGDSPVAGAYDYTYSHLAVVGTPEVLTVSGTNHTQTASVSDLFAVGEYADTQDIVSGTVLRKVGMYVFDGTETWIDGNNGYITEAVQDQNSASYAPLCTHYIGATGTLVQNSNSIRCYRTNGNVGRIYIAPDITAYPTKEDFSAFIETQYDAGTPVIILYPLATPVEEHAVGQQLDTIAGDNTVDWTAEVSGTTKEIEYRCEVPVNN